MTRIPPTSRPPNPWLLSLETLLFPSNCLLCSAQILSGPLCPSCRADILSAAARPACPRCAMTLAAFEHSSPSKGCGDCQGRSLGFDAALALGPYHGPIRDLVLILKRRSGGWLARWLIDLLIQARRPALEHLDVRHVVSVPLHWRRRLARGHNQAEDLARRLASVLGAPYQDPLRRVRPTEKLAGKGRTERASLLRGAFALRRPGTRLEGGVLLVDDILTTGATCGAAARALRAAGSRPIIAVVLARAEGRV